jgi:hypothetical protein
MKTSLQKIRLHLPAALLFVILASILTTPFSTHPGSFMRDHYDSLLNAWILTWNAQQLAEGNLTGLFDTNIFYPHTRTLAYSEHLFPQALVAAVPILVSQNPALGLNLVLWFSFLSSGFSMYLYGRHLSGRAVAGIIAGIVFAFSPFMFTHVVHVQLLAAAGIPLTFLFLSRLAAERRWRDALLLGVVLSFQVLACSYYAVYIAYFTALAGLYFVITGRLVLDRDLLVKLLVLALIVVALTGPFLAQYVLLQEELGFKRIPRVPARLSSFFAVPQENRFWGPILGNHQGETNLFPGLVCCSLAAVGMFSLRKRSEATHPWFAVHVWILVISVLLSFGTTVPGLYRFLYEYAPGFNGLRVVARIHVLTMFSLASLAAIGMARVLLSSRRWVRGSTAVILPFVALVEVYSAPIPALPSLRKDALPAAYQWLAEQPERHVILELPIPPKRPSSVEVVRVYWSLFHGRPMVNGYSGFIPPLHRELARRWNHFPAGLTLADARQLGVRQLVLHTDEIESAALVKTRASLAALDSEAKLVYRDDLSEIWQLAPLDVTAQAAELDGLVQIPSRGWQISASCRQAMAPNAIDGDPTTRWFSDQQHAGTGLTIDMGQTLQINGISMSVGARAGDFPRGYVIEVSQDGSRWILAAQGNLDLLPIGLDFDRG